MLIYFGDAKFPGIIHFFHTQHGAIAVNHFQYVILTDSITQYHNNFIIINHFLGDLNGMAYSLPVYLLYIMRMQIWIVGLYIIPDFIPQITYNKNKFMYTSFLHLVNDDTEHGFACKRNESLWLC